MEPDLVLSQSLPGEGGGSGRDNPRTTRVSNVGSGPATNAYIEVTIEGAGTLINATVRPPGADSSQDHVRWSRTSAPSCRVGTHEVGAVAEVSILMLSESPPPTITVRAVGDESDRNPDDNDSTFTLPSP